MTDLRELEKAATPAPWKARDEWIVLGKPEAMYEVRDIDDAALIVATRNDLSDFLDMADAVARGDLAEAQRIRAGMDI